MKDHNSGAKDQAEEGGVGVAGAKVVPLPRSWYGSVDELVPIDPGPPPGPDGPSSLTDASAFWGGGDGRPEVAEAEHAEEARRSPDAGRSEDAGTNFADPGGDAHSPVRVMSGPAHVKPNVQRRGGRRGLWATVIALSLVAMAAVAATGSLTGRGAPNRVGMRTPTRKTVLTVTQTIPSTTTVARAVGTRVSGLERQRSTKGHGHRTAHPRYRRHTDHAGTGHVQSPAPSVPSRAPSVASQAPSVPSSSAPSRVVTRDGGSGRTSSTAGISKPSCAPSVTNGGGCSL